MPASSMALVGEDSTANGSSDDRGPEVVAALWLLGELIPADGLGSLLAQQILNRHAAPLDAIALVVIAVLVDAVRSLVERRASSCRPGP